ncbi:hypothetical protein ABI59_03955 [Acidobacteria bacterium Mor1]|nr:hypothetical protein ABI59_03955 [Acidobacteria bacterium Mor1]
MGESIDNSQLSRFEKGKAVPSFDKLRALAKVFNVSVQNFSDVLDLEEFAEFKPKGNDYDSLIDQGNDLIKRGEHGVAFMYYERALEVAMASPQREHATEQVADARWRMAASLRSLGKLSMTEAELRSIFKEGELLDPRTRLRCLHDLCDVYRQFGDFYLASVICKEALALAEGSGDPFAEARVLNILGSTYHDEGLRGQNQQLLDQALDCFSRAHKILEEISGAEKFQISVLINLGGCLATSGKADEGIARLRQAATAARTRGYRRAASLAMNRLGEAYFIKRDFERARTSLSEADTLASRSGESYYDILFCNEYLRWRMARDEESGVREKIAFGRLRHLRSMLERKFPEVIEFDEYVESVRRKHVGTSL